MLWIGLTGGIGSGKTTVAEILREKGYPVIDADLLARACLEPGTPESLDVIQAFGPEFQTPDGELDRRKLGRHVFTNKEALVQLERVVHPCVRRKMLEERSRLGKVKMAFYDVPLLFEKEMGAEFDAIVLVRCTDSQQVERLARREGWDEDEVLQRLGNQLPISAKEKLADFVVHNDLDLDHLKSEVEDLIPQLLALHPQS